MTDRSHLVSVDLTRTDTVPTIDDLRDDLIDAGPLCGPEDGELFTGPDEDEADDVRLAREALAKQICAGCPAITECLAYALAVRPEVGVWAGRTAEEINAMTALSGREVA
ncbi:WhiB family transcriptional regulator [Nonomuraea sp. NPDC050643]|uniref:WhiB family transcriptional regulator n=1 Tax=Nonomuraea sp. NPDC050643 TaxID=3155660 RepID=UPI0033C834A3